MLNPSPHNEISAPTPVDRRMTSRNTHNVVEAMLAAESGVFSVLDIPCGRGGLSRRLAARQMNVLAADCAWNPNLPGVTYIATNMNDPLPIATATLDAVACVDGIEHIERQFDFVRECHRVLRPNGLLIVSTPNISSLRSRARWLFTGFHNKAKLPLDEQNPQPRHHIQLLSFAELRYLLHSNGFIITEIRTNCTKSANWLYAPLLPLVYLVTRWVMWRDRRYQHHKAVCADTVKQMLLPAVVFGETIIVKALRHGVLP